MAILTGGAVSAQPQHGIAMYGEPALPPDFEAFSYVNPEAPQGGRIVDGNTGGFDSLNPFIVKGESPWQLRFLTHESLMIRNWDEPFSLYGLLAESVETNATRSWVEYTLREEAHFTDGAPVTPEDVIWSYETLGTQGDVRYRSFWTKVEKIEQTGPRKVRLTFAVEDRELALIAGLTPILEKAQWEGKDFANSTLDEVPVGTGPYVVTDAVPGRSVTLEKAPDYWGRDLPAMRGQANLDGIRIEFFGDQGSLFEAFKAGDLSYLREFNAEKWARDYDFPAAQRGDVVLSEITSARPSGMTGFAMNTRRAPLDDIRVRDALLHAFNFSYINDVITGGRQPRITSVFGGSELAQRDGPAEGRVRALLEPFAAEIPAGTLEGYSLPQGDGTARNRGDLRTAVALLDEAGWTVENGLRVKDGRPLRLEVLLRQGDSQSQQIMNIYAVALERLGIGLTVTTVDNAQYTQRQASYDFDLTDIRRQVSLSPGNEQRTYWGSQVADQEGGRNLMGLRSLAVDAMIDAMLTSTEAEDFTAATRALDRLLTTSRSMIPIFAYDAARIAHVRQLSYDAAHVPIYGDSVYWMPGTWWWDDGA